MFDTIKPPQLVRAALPGVVFTVPGEVSEVYLTFDDGPDPEVTPEILNILNRYSAKATFFCLGIQVRKYPGLTDTIVENGHELGNHGYEHLDGFKTGTKRYVENAIKNTELLDSNLYRPPYGRIAPQQLKKVKNKFQVVLWDIASLDYKTTLTPAKCAKNVLEHVRSGSVILMHDNKKSKENVLGSLPLVLENLSKKGFCFRSLKKLNVLGHTAT